MTPMKAIDPEFEALFGPPDGNDKRFGAMAQVIRLLRILHPGGPWGLVHVHPGGGPPGGRIFPAGTDPEVVASWGNKLIANGYELFIDQEGESHA